MLNNVKFLFFINNRTFQRGDIMTNIGIRLEESEKQAIVEYANAHDLSISQVVRRAIKEFLIKENNKE